MLGAIAQGETQIRGLLLGEDPRSTAACFRAMGATISELNSELVTVQGIGLGQLQEPVEVLDAGNSGTTIRLMLGLLASQPQRFFTVTGDASLRSRPMKRVIQPLQQMGAEIWCRAGGYAPLAVQGQVLKPIHFQSPIASAQVKSCVLLAGLLTEGRTTVTEPALSRDHSERMLRAFGVDVQAVGGRVALAGRQRLRGCALTVPGDVSSAAFFLVGGALAAREVLVLRNVGVNPTRTGVLEILRLMGADLRLVNERRAGDEPVADVEVRRSELRGIEVPRELVPLAIDEFPVLFVAAACARGTTVVAGAEELRVKESDRIATMAEGLAALGIEVEPRPDGLRIEGGALRGGRVDSHGDHRIAMSFAIAALRATGPVEVADVANVATSFPGFTALAHRAGLSIEAAP